MVLLVALVFAHPASGSTLTKQFEVSSQSYLGSDQLTVTYNSTATATVGTNLTVSALVSVDSLTGSEQYVRDYVMLVTLFCNDHATNGSAGSPTPTQRYLYPGARWGPFNVSIPLTEADTGLAPGEGANASVTLSLITDISFSAPGYGLGGYAPVSGDGSTFVQIQDPGALQASPAGAPVFPFLPSILVVGGVALLAVRLAVFRPRK
jgi:hypothetical protein